MGTALTKSFLSDPKYLTTLVTALVKKFDGEIRISQAEMEDVHLSDLVSMYYDVTTNEIILTVIATADLIDQEFEN
jgi:hypothetical protein